MSTGLLTPESQAYSFEAHPDNSLFFDAHRTELEALFTILGLRERSNSDLRSAVEVTQPWVEGDHFNPVNRIVLSGDAASKAKELYESMGLVGVVELPPGDYDEVLVLGGTQRANNARLRFLKKALDDNVHLKANGEVLLLGGPRPIDADLEQSYVDQNRSQTSKEEHQANNNRWLKVINAGANNINDETDGLRLAALEHLGDLILSKMHLNLGSTQPIVSRYEFEGSKSQVTLLSTSPVPRPKGEARHTTEACINHWLNLYPARDARVAFISSNPYLRRTALVARQVIRQRGRADIQFVAGGPAAYPDAKDYLFLGEIARNLFEDLKAI